MLLLRQLCVQFSLQATRPLKDYPRNSHHRHIAFLSVIEDAPLLTKTVKIDQSEGVVPGSGIPERTFVKNSYKRSRTSVPLYFSALSLLRTALLYLNAWNRLGSVSKRGKCVSTQVQSQKTSRINCTGHSIMHRTPKQK